MESEFVAKRLRCNRLFVFMMIYAKKKEEVCDSLNVDLQCMAV